VKALFIVWDSPESGRGHVVRCGALADELRSRGWECANLQRGEAGEADVLIVDDPEAHVRKGAARVVQIVDTPGQAYVDADLLICGGAAAQPGMFVHCSPKEMLIGPRYALLRPEFRAWIRDDHGAIFDARAVSGLSADEMAVRMVHSGVVITYGGVRAMEAACLGAPMIVIPRNDGEELNALGLMAAGAAVYVTPEAERDAVFDICQAKAEYLLTDEKKRQQMSEAGRMVVDGRGCERVADAIEAMCGHAEDVHTRALKALAAAEARWGIVPRKH
jgi:spore coat polysaccharide biosynthesis predicted glycosyltransferase SpsG